jgi:3-oxoacyl-[acyl-carrier protein] reductase
MDHGIIEWRDGTNKFGAVPKNIQKITYSETGRTGDQNMRLKEKIALITGGASGIGKAVAERFVEEGARVVVCDVNEKSGQDTVQSLGTGHSFYKVDITDRSRVQEWVDDVADKYGRIDILINNAGILRDSILVKFKDGEQVGQMTEADFDIVIAVNLKGVFNCTQAAAPYMIRQGSGVVLNASSVSGLDGNFGQTNYTASKAGVIGMTKVWARELGPSNSRVNVVAPGPTATEMVKSMPEKILNRFIEHTPLGRVGQPRDIANAYLFLASDEADFITGAVLRVDGGIVFGT